MRKGTIAGCLLLGLACPPAWATLPALRADSAFRRDVSLAPVHPDSANITAWLENAGGWGLGRFQIDFSIEVVQATASDPSVSLTPNPGYYSDCDPDGVVPLPPGGAIEGHPDYRCTGGGDCHLLVWDPARELLFEAWQADVTAGVFTATCLVEWNLRASYPPSGRGEGCTSADAAGFPIAPLLFDADEIASGSIDHAIRFILPNSRMRTGYYMHPASHYGAPSAASSSPAPIFGMRFRLRPDFPVDKYPPAAQVVLRALQRYGMFLADGGNVALTARSDRETTASWADVGLGSRDIEDVAPSDFEVLEGSGPSPLKGPYAGWPDCVKNEIPAPEPPRGLSAALALLLLTALARRRRISARGSDLRTCSGA